MPKVMKASAVKKTAVKKSAANVNSRRLKKPATKKSAAVGKPRKLKSLWGANLGGIVIHGDLTEPTVPWTW